MLKKIINIIFSKKEEKALALKIYTEIIRQSRQEYFYKDLLVDDTIDGRFDLIVLHVFFVMSRLKFGNQSNSKLSQCLLDLMFSDFDSSLRELGFGDVSVNKKAKDMIKAFYGRIQRYDQVFSSGKFEEVSSALVNNIYRNRKISKDVIEKLTKYSLETHNFVGKKPLDEVDYCINMFPIVNKT